MHSTSGCNGYQRPAQPEGRNNTSYNFRNHALDGFSSGIWMESGDGECLVQSTDSSSSVAVPLWIYTYSEDEAGRYDRQWRSCLCICCNAVYGT